MPLWYIYYRLCREMHFSPFHSLTVRMADVAADLRTKAIAECAAANPLEFVEFMRAMYTNDLIIYKEPELLHLLKMESWFNPVKQGDTDANS